MDADTQLTENLELIRELSISFRLSTMDPPVVVDGEPISFRDFPWIPRLIDDTHPHISILKGAQMGFTIAMVLRTIERAQKYGLRGSIYLFPRERDSTDFSKARFSRILSENQVMSGYVHDTDSIGIKRVGRTYIYFRGANSIPGLKSIPADDLVLDERDEMLDDMVELAYHRLDGSRDPHIVELSTPTVPGFGVDAAYQESDQHVWMIKCEACNEYTCLELTFPNCFVGDADRGYIRACGKCGEKIYPHNGDWVAKRIDVQHTRGYWVSQLNSARRDPNTLMFEWDRAQSAGKLKEFYNSVLGTAYADLDDILTPQAVREACDEAFVRQTGDDGPTCFGADVGVRDFHWSVGKRVSPSRVQTIAWGVAETEQEVIDIIRKFKVTTGVIDSMAEVRTVRRLIDKFPGKIYGNYYVEGKKTYYDWNESEGLVSSGRTESLDNSHRAIISGALGFPRYDDFCREIVSPQLCNLARIVEIKEGSGDQKARWVVRGRKNDHFRHAINYMMIASERTPVAKIKKSSGIYGNPFRKFSSNRSWMST